jgi:pullulanase-type alpha-1,6-glucosidase
MEFDEATGVWNIMGEESWKGQYYLYKVKVFAPLTGKIETNLVTDPYSISLSMNGTRSQIVDLNDADLKPQGWDSLQKPTLAAPEDIVVYELHIRDFSVSDETVPEELRGTYKAFTVKDSNGMKHLTGLAQAGLTHIHLLPAFDIASVNEDKSTWQSVDEETIKSYPPDSDQQSIAVSAVTGTDGFNWGYDPIHYTTPDGSYATDPNGTPRIVEFREMVGALNESGLRVVMDVVYNHTNASGQSDNSVLDRVVPGYYHRLNGDGNVEQSTCCQNTATEHDMMRKLMVDSVVTWATQYKVDGFRFDLMGHHMLDDMIAVRAALDALTLEKDGVDGKSIYVYG